MDPAPNSDQLSPPPMESGPRCTNSPCSKLAKMSDEWGLYYCSEECLVLHSRSAGAGGLHGVERALRGGVEV